MLVGSFKYVVPQYYSPCATDLQRAIFIYYVSYSEASLSLVIKWTTENPLMMLKVVN